jgi:hypothetical protein
MTNVEESMHYEDPNYYVFKSHCFLLSLRENIFLGIFSQITYPHYLD